MLKSTLDKVQPDSELKQSHSFSIEDIAIPTIVVRTGDQKLFTNKSASEFFKNQSIDIVEKKFDQIFRVEESDSDLQKFFHRVEIINSPKIEKIHLHSIDKFVPYQFLIFPLKGKGNDRAICMQLLHDDEKEIFTIDPQTNLDLLVQERTAELNELNRFLTAIVDSSTETFIIAVGSNGLILSFNEGACHLFHQSKSEVVGREHIQSFLADPNLRNQIWNEMVAEAQTTGMCRRMVDMVQKNGKIFPALSDLTPLRNDENQVLGMLFVGRDVTESHFTQIALEQRKQELEFINTLSLEISQTLDPEEIGLISLKNTLRILQGFAGGLYIKFDSEDDPKLVASDVPNEFPALSKYVSLSSQDHNHLEDGEIIIRDTPIDDDVLKKQLGKQYIYVLALQLTSKAKYVGAMIIIFKKKFTDTGELKRFVSAIGATVGSAIDNAILYADTIKKSAEIKRQNKELDEFAYIVSHDLKEPLAGISFISSLIIQDYYDKFDVTGQTYIASLVDFSKRLDTLIDALLDLSRIGRVIQPFEEVDVDVVLKEVIQNLAYRIENQKIKIIKPMKFLPVNGEKTRITQVFFNLMGNAMKFNNKEKPIVEVGFQDYAEDPNLILFYVRDNGIGIEEVYFDQIFKIFERLHSREEYEGTGAGLTIVKKIVEHHGGKIWVESKLDEGSIFYFTLPRYQNDV